MERAIHQLDLQAEHDTTGALCWCHPTYQCGFCGQGPKLCRCGSRAVFLVTHRSGKEIMN